MLIFTGSLISAAALGTLLETRSFISSHSTQHYQVTILLLTLYSVLLIF
jgi:hypothetical protein